MDLYAPLRQEVHQCKIENEGTAQNDYMNEIYENFNILNSPQICLVRPWLTSVVIPNMNNISFMDLFPHHFGP